jgi:hypothetical protein
MIWASRGPRRAVPGSREPKGARSTLSASPLAPRPSRSKSRPLSRGSGACWTSGSPASPEASVGGGWAAAERGAADTQCVREREGGASQIGARAAAGRMWAALRARSRRGRRGRALRRRRAEQPAGAARLAAGTAACGSGRRRGSPAGRRAAPAHTTGVSSPRRPLRRRRSPRRRPRRPLLPPTPRRAAPVRPWPSLAPTGHLTPQRS